MKNYRVTWTIDLNAVTPEEAAQIALDIHRDPDSIATCFEVSETFHGISSVFVTWVDLLKEKP